MSVGRTLVRGADSAISSSEGGLPAPFFRTFSVRSEGLRALRMAVAGGTAKKPQ